MSVEWRRKSDTQEVLDTIKQAYGRTPPHEAEIVADPAPPFEFSDDEVLRTSAQLRNLKARLSETEADDLIV